MKTRKLVLIIVTLLCNEILSAPFDSGYITWTQPNGVTFVARSWGDEFENWMETDNGYRIINGPNQYFYYAVLDSRGEFYPSNYKVGIDKPLSTSYLLQRTQDRIQQIEQERIDFGEQLQINFNNYINDPRFNGNTTPPMHVAIVLVDFTPSVRGDYTKADFDTLFFSTNYYISPAPNEDPRSPNSEQVFGSFRDYYLNQSLGRLDIRGKINDDRSIMNPTDPNNPTKPQWVIMPYSKSFYDLTPRFEVIPLIIEQINAQLPFNFDNYDAIGFIYAGEGDNIAGGTCAFGGYGKLFAAYEKYHQTFAHIGIPAHEFAHNLGAYDEYNGTFNPGEWDLMAQGMYNGPDYYNTGAYRGSCPAPFDPAYRIMYGWISTRLLTPPTPPPSFIIEYDPDYPIFYKVEIPASDEYFIIERRRKNGFDRYTPAKEVNNINFPPKGILLWHIAPQKSLNFDMVELELANNDPLHRTLNRFPSPLGSVQDFTDLSTPSSKKRNGDLSYVSIDNIEWIGDEATGHAVLEFDLNALQINGNETWAQDMDLTQSVFINSGATLTISQGININIVGSSSSQTKFYVLNGGTLIIEGADGNEATINSTTQWGGIVIYGNGIFQGDYCTLTNAKKTFEMLNENSNCTINNSKIRVADQGCIFQGNISINNTSFENAPVSIEKSNTGSQVTRCKFSTDNLNQNGLGLVNPATSYLLLRNCTINGFHVGILLGEESQPYWDRTTQIVILNNIISNCQKSIEIQLGSITINFNNFYNNAQNNYLGTNYLMVNPLYVDPVNKNFSLQWGSGCIDAGNPLPLYNDPDGTRNDMGGLFYNQSPVVPTDFYFLKDVNNHPELHWTGVDHLTYKIYAEYELYAGGTLNVTYTATAETYTDITVTLVRAHYANQQVTYSVTSVNNLEQESAHSTVITLNVYGGIWKKSFTDSSFVPVVYNLFPAYPNPFNPSTNIAFDLPENSLVTLKVYNVTGEEIKTLVNNTLTAGRHNVVFEGNGIPSGIYFVRIVTKDYLNTKKLILMK